MRDSAERDRRLLKNFCQLLGSHASPRCWWQAAENRPVQPAERPGRFVRRQWIDRISSETCSNKKFRLDRRSLSQQAGGPYVRFWVTLGWAESTESCPAVRESPRHGSLHAALLNRVLHTLCNKASRGWAAAEGNQVRERWSAIGSGCSARRSERIAALGRHRTAWLSRRDGRYGFRCHRLHDCCRAGQFRCDNRRKPLMVNLLHLEALMRLRKAICPL